MNVTIGHGDTVATAKRKLSQLLSVRSSDIGLVFKNRIMYDYKPVSEYNIGSDRYVSWFINDDDSICSSQTGRSGVVQFQYSNLKDWTLTSLDRNTRPFSVRQVTNLSGIIDGISSRLNCPRDSIKLSDDIGTNKAIKEIDNIHNLSIYDDYTSFSEKVGSDISVLITTKGRKFRANVSRNDHIGVLDNVMRYRNIESDEYLYGSCLLDKHRTFRDYGIKTDDVIEAIIKLTGGGCVISRTGYPDQIQLVPLHPNIDLLYSYKFNLSDIINAMSNQLDYPTSQIKLFQDKSRTNPIKTNEHLRQVFETNPNKIYFSIGISYLEKNFTEIKLLDTGSFGNVYRYRNIRSNKYFAVKKLEIPVSGIKESLMNEISILSTLSSHERIIKFEEYIETDDALYIVMEYMAGGSLGTYIKNNGALNEQCTKKYSKQVLQALKHLHDNKILHRDIKGDNILLDKNNNVKLADFGLSENLCDIASKNYLNGAVQSCVGTAYWTAPEIIDGEHFELSADIWSFGATMVEMVTGKHLFYNLKPYMAMKAIRKREKISFSCQQNISKPLKGIIESCLHPDPSQRPTCDKLLKQI